MLANYGYKDGSGDFFITVDTERCDGCGDCVPACPAHVFELRENDFDLDSLTPIAAVTEEQSKKLKYACGPCKPAHGYAQRELPCVKACGAKQAIAHSW
jgi:Fe-S-cluster-containing dehydrogenase component